PLARALLRLGELVGGHLARDRVAVLDRGGAVARVVCGKARGGEIEPHMRVDDVLRHALAAGVGEAEMLLRLGVDVVGGGAVAECGGTPRPSPYIAPSVKRATALPWSAARRNHFAASLSFCGTPRPR